MERLTHPRCSGIKTGYWSPNKKDELIERLAAYEDTDLSPEEIKALRENGKTPEHRWIPVEERLPEDEQIVWASTKDGYVEKMIYKKSNFITGLETFHFYDDSMDWLDKENIVAWLPYKEPEPYRRE